MVGYLDIGVMCVHCLNFLLVGTRALTLAGTAWPGILAPESDFGNFLLRLECASCVL